MGKTKKLEQDQSKSGFSGLVLGAATTVSHTIQEVITNQYHLIECTDPI
jgi:hypothetical protein